MCSCMCLCGSEQICVRVLTETRVSDPLKLEWQVGVSHLTVYIYAHIRIQGNVYNYQGAPAESPPSWTLVMCKPIKLPE